jgi:peptide/nickel transport system substrate-binding protein
VKNARLAIVLLFTSLLAGCSGPAPASRGASDSSAPQAAQATKTLVIILRQEPLFLAGTAPTAANITTGTQRRLFNAGLVQEDAAGAKQPYLAETVPQLNTDSWKVSADGKMETTYRLKPGLTWHDGTPLTAADFVFAWKAYQVVEMGVANARPNAQMDEVSAPDERTVLIKWKVLYPDAGELEGSGGGGAFTPLPRHLLERAYETERDNLANHAYFNREFVGLGPFKLDKWEPGAFIEASAFDKHAWARPKIDRLRLLANPDPNTALATLLAGEAHIPADDSIRIQQAIILANEWSSRNGGTIQYRPTLSRFTQVQHRPEFVNPAAVQDLSVRRALAHTIDKQTTNESLLEGQGILADTLIPPGVPYFAELDRSITKYAFDARRAEQLMADAGYRKGPNNFYLSKSGEPMTFELKVIASAQNSAERAIMADGWRRQGFNFEENDFSPAQAQQGELLGQFRSLSTTSGTQGESAIASFQSSSISNPQNGWRGMNRGGWSNPDYDRFAESFNTTLDRNQRNRLVIDAWRVWTDHLAAIPLYFNPSALVIPSSLKGINVISPSAEMSWNIHEWELV